MKNFDWLREALHIRASANAEYGAELNALTLEALIYLRRATEVLEQTKSSAKTRARVAAAIKELESSARGNERVSRH